MLTSRVHARDVDGCQLNCSNARACDQRVKCLFEMVSREAEFDLLLQVFLIMKLDVASWSSPAFLRMPSCKLLVNNGKETARATSRIPFEFLERFRVDNDSINHQIRAIDLIKCVPS